MAGLLTPSFAGESALLLFGTEGQELKVQADKLKSKAGRSPKEIGRSAAIHIVLQWRLEITSSEDAIVYHVSEYREKFTTYTGEEYLYEVLILRYNTRTGKRCSSFVAVNRFTGEIDHYQRWLCPGSGSPDYWTISEAEQAFDKSRANEVALERVRATPDGDKYQYRVAASYFYDGFPGDEPGYNVLIARSRHGIPQKCSLDLFMSGLNAKVQDTFPSKRYWSKWFCPEP